MSEISELLKKDLERAGDSVALNLKRLIFVVLIKTKKSKVLFISDLIF